MFVFSYVSIFDMGEDDSDLIYILKKWQFGIESPTFKEQLCDLFTNIHEDVTIFRISSSLWGNPPVGHRQIP